MQQKQHFQHFFRANLERETTEVQEKIWQVKVDVKNCDVMQSRGSCCFAITPKIIRDGCRDSSKK